MPRFGTSQLELALEIGEGDIDQPRSSPEAEPRLLKKNTTERKYNFLLGMPRGIGRLSPPSRSSRSGFVSVSLSAVSGAPLDGTVRSCMLFDGALRIQRLEGSRPHGSLCTLHGSERVQRDQVETELGEV